MKPKRMWTESRYFPEAHHWCEKTKGRLNDLPVLVVPLDPESVEAFRNALMGVLQEGYHTCMTGDVIADNADAILKLLGMSRPKKAPIRPSRSSGTGRGAGKKT